METDDDRAMIALTGKRLWYEDIRRNRMSVNYAIYLSQDVKAIAFRVAGVAGHSTIGAIVRESTVQERARSHRTSH